MTPLAEVAARRHLLKAAATVTGLAATLCAVVAFVDWRAADPGSSWQYEVFVAIGVSVSTSLMWCAVIGYAIKRLVDRLVARSMERER